MASSSTVAKVALDKVAWEFVQDECESKSKYIKRLRDQVEDQDDHLEYLKLRLTTNKKRFRDQIEDLDNHIDYLKARLATLKIANSEMSNNLDAAREEVARLRATNKRLESENDCLREQVVSAPPAKILCTVARR